MGCGAKRRRGRRRERAADADAGVDAALAADLAALGEVAAAEGALEDAAREPAAPAPTAPPARPAASPPPPAPPAGRALEREGGGYARAVALTVLGTAPPDAETAARILRWGGATTDREPPEPRDVLEVIPRRALAQRVVAAGGAWAYLRRRHGPGRYRLLWIGASGETLAEAVYDVPDPRGELRARETAWRAEQAARHEEARQRRAERRAAAEEAALAAWVDEQTVAYLRRRGPLAAATAESVGALRDFLATHADVFVEVVHGGWVRSSRPGGWRWERRIARAWVVWRRDPLDVVDALNAFARPESAA